MGKKLDLMGKRFGRLTVIEVAGRNEYGNVLWKCLCDCGNMSVVRGYQLKNGHTMSCGCLHKECIIELNRQKALNLIGQRFGRLVVLEKVDNIKCLSWLCLCDCGNEVIIRTGNLNNGSTKSCGCLQKESTSRLDLAGQRFDRLLVLEYVYTKNSDAYWRCVCNCGNEIEVSTGRLRCGNTRSCGCYRQDMLVERNIRNCGFLSSNWKGGISCEPYCDVWLDREFKDSIKQRDDYRCMNPDCYGVIRRLSIHHIDYDKKNCNPNNLITVCISCNSRANFDREWHTAWYQAIMYMRYDYSYEL